MFEERLKELRENKGINQVKMAKLIGVDRSRYCKWENGNAKPSIDFILRICEVFGCSTDYLLGAPNKIEPKFTSCLESKLFSAYHALSDIGKETAVHQVESLVEVFPEGGQIGKKDATA